jgi:hypothetical protein
MAHRTVRCTRSYNSEPATLGNSRACSAIIHWTVWWASRATALCAPTIDWQDEQCNTVSRRSQSSEVRGAPDCPVQLEDKSSNGRPAPNPNGWLTWRHTGQRTVSIRCAHRQQPWPTATKWWGAINTPNHHNLWYPSFSQITFNTRASAFTPRHISKDQTLSKCQIHLNHFVT